MPRVGILTYAAPLGMGISPQQEWKFNQRVGLRNTLNVVVYFSALGEVLYLA